MAEKFSDYSGIEPLLADVKLPRMFRATQTFPRSHIEDVAAETRKQLIQSGVRAQIRPGHDHCGYRQQPGVSRT